MEKELKKILTAIAFHNLRTLHGVTPRDTYILNYRGHLERCKDDFFDIHCLAFGWGASYHPKKIMEIGTRTGLSLVALLSAYQDFEGMRVVVFDLFDDGMCSPELVKKHLSHLYIPTDFIEFYIGNSTETVPKFKETNKDHFDWILVDGGHSVEQATIDLENVVDLLALGGLLVMDDISATIQSDGFDLRPAWKGFQEKHYNEFLFWSEDPAGKGTAWAQKR